MPRVVGIWACGVVGLGVGSRGWGMAAPSRGGVCVPLPLNLGGFRDCRALTTQASDAVPVPTPGPQGAGSSRLLSLLSPGTHHHAVGELTPRGEKPRLSSQPRTSPKFPTAYRSHVKLDPQPHRGLPAVPTWSRDELPLCSNEQLQVHEKNK